MAGRRIPEGLQVWIEARRRFHLSHAQVQMARELGLNPKKLGKLANDDQEPWKLPLPLFIEQLYSKQFGKPRPEVVMSIEERARLQEAKKAVRRAAKQRAREARGAVSVSGRAGDEEGAPEEALGEGLSDLDES